MRRRNARPAPMGATATAPERTRPKDVRDMNRSELEAYAIELGLRPRALELTDDRLRQNIIAYLDEMYEDA